ncbi:hypothetical protein TI39_contig354g00154 [Zymoseptoria brevis]|uniref:JmjC domain-containing protein n=1 Tax=Zymoseptoria brevis TaxID=1047168 RepID=A0A0F4GQ94_9PEZI|nr:hypothetical protein TI39_contig354g00154 [Zymoseptoria brevis]
MEEDNTAARSRTAPLDVNSTVRPGLLVKLDFSPIMTTSTDAPPEDATNPTASSIFMPRPAQPPLKPPPQPETTSIRKENVHLPSLSDFAPETSLPTVVAPHQQSIQHNGRLTQEEKPPSNDSQTGTEETSFAQALLQLKHGHASSFPHDAVTLPVITAGSRLPPKMVFAGPDEPTPQKEVVTVEKTHERVAEPELDCISVHRPRPAGEDLVQPDDLPTEQASGPREEREQQEPRSDASSTQSLIVVMRLPHARSNSMQLSIPAAPKSEDITYPSPQTHATTPSEVAGASPPALQHSEMPTPPSDADVQEPDVPVDPTGFDEIEPAQSQTAPVVLPVDMMKFEAGLYARERNPRRTATRLYSEVKTPEKAARPKPPPKAKPAKAFVQPSPPQRVSERTSKRARVENIPSPDKRRKLSIASASTSRRNSLATRPEVEAKPFFTLDGGETRPTRDVDYDQEYVAKISEVLGSVSKAKVADTHKQQATRILYLLQQAKPASVDEALYLTASEAEEHLRPGKFTKQIIVTAQQQPLPLQTIDQFLDEFYEDEVKVWIQDSSARPSKNSPNVRQVKVSAVKERILGGATKKPWNLLELATHHEDGLRPAFLNNEDCRLLTKLKIPGAADEARRRTYPQGFKEVEKWALLAQAGALTEPHQDSHGYSTYITINVGHVGFGWLSFPTDAERAQWRKKPLSYTGGTWRYVVLKPGQTVFFPAGTVHFVFRLPSAGNSLAFGGHILRCSNIAHWARTLLEERDATDVTNEDLTDSATGYLERVGRFVEQAVRKGELERWGGMEEVDEFLRLKEEFLRRK